MYEQIKKLADDAIKLQNKNAIDAALRTISELAKHPQKGWPYDADRGEYGTSAAADPEVIAAQAGETEKLRILVAKSAKKAGKK